VRPMVRAPPTARAPPRGLARWRRTPDYRLVDNKRVSHLLLAPRLMSQQQPARTRPVITHGLPPSMASPSPSSPTPHTRVCPVCDSSRSDAANQAAYRFNFRASYVATRLQSR
jgi:hypothetical protein